MRRLLIVVFSITILASNQGCRMQKIAGGCDVNPPPVNSLLIAPHPRPAGDVVPHNGYAATPYATSNGGHPQAVVGKPVPNNTPVAQPLPSILNSTPPAVAPKTDEAIKVLPKLEEKVKDK
jgi:hypothetical protein